MIQGNLSLWSWFYEDEAKQMLGMQEPYKGWIRNLKFISKQKKVYMEFFRKF